MYTPREDTQKQLNPCPSSPLAFSRVHCEGGGLEVVLAAM
jgi:hypothetical protein